MKILKNFSIHFALGLMLFLIITGLTFGLGSLFDGGWGTLSFYILVGLPGGYTVFLYLTTYYNWKITITQYLLTGFRTFAANGEIEPLYHDFLQNL